MSMEAENIVEICQQATTIEHTADWEDLIHSGVNCKVCELAIALQLLSITDYVYKCAINPITNP
jgi:hypothetical protein